MCDAIHVFYVQLVCSLPPPPKKCKKEHIHYHEHYDHGAHDFDDDLDGAYESSEFGYGSGKMSPKYQDDEGDEMMYDHGEGMPSMEEDDDQGLGGFSSKVRLGEKPRYSFKKYRSNKMRKMPELNEEIYEENASPEQEDNGEDGEPYDDAGLVNDEGEADNEDSTRYAAPKRYKLVKQGRLKTQFKNGKKVIKNYIQKWAKQEPSSQEGEAEEEIEDYENHQEPETVGEPNKPDNVETPTVSPARNPISKKVTIEYAYHQEAPSSNTIQNIEFIPKSELADSIVRPASNKSLGQEFEEVSSETSLVENNASLKTRATTVPSESKGIKSILKKLTLPNLTQKINRGLEGLKNKTNEFPWMGGKQTETIKMEQEEMSAAKAHPHKSPESTPPPQPIQSSPQESVPDRKPVDPSPPNQSPPAKSPASPPFQKDYPHYPSRHYPHNNYHRPYTGPPQYSPPPGNMILTNARFQMPPPAMHFNGPPHPPHYMLPPMQSNPHYPPPNGFIVEHTIERAPLVVGQPEMYPVPIAARSYTDQSLAKKDE